MTTEIPSDLASALAARYELRALLGRGGMATVYLAHDRKHHRTVALKVLRPELAASLGAERFLKEIEIVAQLTHPHILGLHDSGEARPERNEGPGFLYYVMPYIDGGSLRQRMQQDGRVDSARALAIATPVAEAVSFAHRMGVLHRDIKPENILFSQGHPIVSDFGIAKAVSSASGANLTRTGLALGTPGYMSPEQAAGFSELDERTDVYSLAVVIYEMMVGEIPGRWPTEDAVRAGRFLEAAPAHRLRLSAVGSRIEEALMHGLAIRLDQRTETPGALIDELRGTATPRHRYRADEVDAIVKRAAELEAANPTSSGAMTIGGVEAIAAEVGIAPSLVRSAVESLSPRATAGEMTPIDRPARNRLIGGPTRLVFERLVNGEVPESEFPVLVDEIRRVVRNVGQVSQLGRTFSWVMSRASAGRRDMEVVVSVRAGRTRITVQENLAQLIGAIFGGIGGGIGGGMGGGGMGPIMGILTRALHIEPAVLSVVVPAWLLTTFAVARTTFHYRSRRRQRELEQLVDRLAALAQELIADTPRLANSS